MMLNKRLIGTACDSKKYIAGNVIFQWISLVANICLMTDVTYFLASVFHGQGELVNVQGKKGTREKIREWLFGI